MPGFIDIQVNGYAGVDFCGEPISHADLSLVVDKLRLANVRSIFPTVITDTPARISSKLERFRTLIDAEPTWRALMPAFHVEGPCLSPLDGYKGAHLPELMTDATPEVFKPIIDAAGGPDRVAIITLAPEQDPGLKTTRWLANQGIVVSAGHTNAPYELLQEAVREGLSMFTHVGNGCPAVMPRHDNIINRAFATEGLTLCFIPDGYHLPFWMLREWIKRVDPSRVIFTTDCMSAAGAPPGVYKIAHWTLEVGEDRLVRPVGKTHLAGSALSMPESYANSIQKLGMTREQADLVNGGNAARIFAKKLTH